MATASLLHEGKRRGAMKEFKDRVAVITGAASGIGRAMADRCGQEGMKTVLADVGLEGFTKTQASMKNSRATVPAGRTDVSQARDVEALAQKTLEVFGAIPEAQRVRLFTAIGRLIDEEYGGYLDHPHLTTLWMARKPH